MDGKTDFGFGIREVLSKGLGIKMDHCDQEKLNVCEPCKIEDVVELINRLPREALHLAEAADTDFRTLGMDSISYIHLIVALEEKYDIEIPEDYLKLNGIGSAHEAAELVNRLRGLPEGGQ